MSVSDSFRLLEFVLTFLDFVFWLMCVLLLLWHIDDLINLFRSRYSTIDSLNDSYPIWIQGQFSWTSFGAWLWYVLTGIVGTVGTFYFTRWIDILILA